MLYHEMVVCPSAATRQRLDKGSSNEFSLDNYFIHFILQFCTILAGHIILNPILWSFGHSECNRVNFQQVKYRSCNAVSLKIKVQKL